MPKFVDVHGCYYVVKGGGAHPYEMGMVRSIGVRRHERTA